MTRHTSTLRSYLQQSRATAAIDQARYLAMLPFAAHVFDDEMVFDSHDAYRAAVVAADEAEAAARSPGGPSETPPVLKNA